MLLSMRRRRDFGLTPAPKPRDPTDSWKMLCLGISLFAVATTVGAYGLGKQNARSEFVQQVHDADYYAELAEGCAATLGRTTHAGEQAARLLWNRRLLQSWVLHLTTPRRELVAAVDD